MRKFHNLVNYSLNRKPVAPPLLHHSYSWTHGGSMLNTEHLEAPSLR